MAMEQGVVEVPSVLRRLDGESHQQESSRDRWSDGSKLLFQDGYFKVLKELALSGQLQQYNLRSVCWKLFLGCLPEERGQWEEVTLRTRELYTQLKQKHIVDPHMASASLDVTVNNPLSLEENSPWNQFFQDNELRQMIEQDVVRTFPDVQFFRQHDIQSTMLDILFCYAKEHEELCYRQGMHELLAPILFVLHAEMRDINNDPTLAPALRVVMDPMFIEHDAFTIFSELMECIDPWYMVTNLEADRVTVRRNFHQKMNYDPRHYKPFSAENYPTSAISRKLDMIHNVLLKKADFILYRHLQQLAIPPQTYGIRWIRLLFGREFPLPSVLELWDALFADGPSLALVDYMCVAMLMHIRQVLIGGNYAECMQQLMRFPAVYEVSFLVNRALHLRNPSHYPARHFGYSPSPPLTTFSPFQPPSSTPHHPQNTATSQSRASKAGTKAKHVLSTATRQIPKVLTRQPKSEGQNTAYDHSPSPGPAPIFPEPRPKGRGKVIGETNSAREMTNNPKARPPSTITQGNKVERLTNRLEGLEAKCRYCGSKMDSLLSALQEEVTELKDLDPEAENIIFLSIAGLKQVRDLLLNKIPFSGEPSIGWEVAPRANRKQESLEDSYEATPPQPLETPADTEEHRTVGALLPTPSDQSDVRIAPPPIDGAEETDFHPLLSSGEALTLPEGVRGDRVCEGAQWEVEEWVHVPESLPADTS